MTLLDDYLLMFRQHNLCVFTLACQLSLAPPSPYQPQHLLKANLTLLLCNMGSAFPLEFFFDSPLATFMSSTQIPFRKENRVLIEE